MQLTSATRQVLSRECKTNSQKQLHAVTASSPMSSAGQCHATFRSALWLPIDLYLEDTMDGGQVRVTSAVETLTGTSIYRCTIPIFLANTCVFRFLNLEIFHGRIGERSAGFK